MCSTGNIHMFSNLHDIAKALDFSMSNKMLLRRPKHMNYVRILRCATLNMRFLLVASDIL